MSEKRTETKRRDSKGREKEQQVDKPVKPGKPGSIKNTKRNKPADGGNQKAGRWRKA